MRFHVISLPHTQVDGERFSSCAYTEKVRKFCLMMRGLGHHVILYAGDQSDDVADEIVPIFTEKERIACLEGAHYTAGSFDRDKPHWQKFNKFVIHEMACQRLQPQDFICVIGGWAHQPIAAAYPQHQTVEFGIGYSGTFSDYKVFESYAWMHMIYGHSGPPENAMGNFYDAVIPNYFEPERFPYGEAGDYFLYMGRLIDRKGWTLAQDVCERLGERLIIAGPGEFSGYGEYVGEVGWRERGELMSHAKATFTPTLYVEPFCGVHVEAMMCGSPIISTDWGVFPETVNGNVGFRCRTFDQFMRATKMVGELNRKSIRKYARSRFSMDVVAKQYEAYFTRLLDLYGEGFYAE